MILDLAISVICHELGHIAAAKLLGVRIKRIGINWIGPYVVRERSSKRAVNVAVSLAGIGANLLLAGGCWATNFGVANVIVALVCGGPDIWNAIGALRSRQARVVEMPGTAWRKAA
jgi:Zn-dependent protease